MSREDALRTVADFFAPQIKQKTVVPDIVEWAERNFYIPEESAPIRLQPVQRCFLKYAFGTRYVTLLYSTIKKSGKTAISGLVGRYTAEFSGNKAEVYYVANDKEQAKDRAYEAAKTSIELSPMYDGKSKGIPGQWRIIEKEATHIPTGSIMRAIASDYEGAAGANPNMTLWTELWGMTTERMKRLWDEMTPVPTRKLSRRYVETYAGFTDESELLYDLYKVAVLGGRRLTVADLEAVCGVGCWPYTDPPPFYVNEAARTFAYWDEGVHARRMPWQQGEEGEAYYREQETTLRPDAFQRLHGNYWTSSTQKFLPLVWWQNCKIPAGAVPAYKPTWPVVIAVDASISNDCTAIVGVSRWPNRPETDVVVRFADVFYPKQSAGGVIDYAEVKQRIIERCKQFNVVEVSYDVYQLHQMMQELTREAVAWCKQFSQATDREVADADLYKLILNRQIHHNDEFDEKFVDNAAAYSGANVASGRAGAGKGAKVERLRIVKSAKDKQVDPLVATSMAASECLRLLL